MTWKKDLAKLKQALGQEEIPPARPAPPPRAGNPKEPVRSIEEEDQVFLSAMGTRAKSPRPEAPGAPLERPRLTPAPAGPAAAGEFNSAMGDLKGLKPMRQGPAAAAPRTPSAAPGPGPAAGKLAAQAPVPEPPEPAPAPAPEPVSAPSQSVARIPPGEAQGPAGPPQAQIHLAAGMAVVVDGSLDLKGHGRSDAEERLKERILDGYALGWRTLHVIVGASPELRQMVLELLSSPAGRCVVRYAQAPVPMGGSQAWILYFRSQIPAEN
jgi:DNA-nicking Smr family endonuclease